MRSGRGPAARSRRRRVSGDVFGTLALCAMLVLGGCGSSEPVATENSSWTGSSLALDPGAEVTLSLDELVEAQIESVEDFWLRTLSEFSPAALRPIDAVVGYDPALIAELPECNGRVADPELYRSNAFFCRQENIVVYDEVLLLPRIRSRYGDLAIGALLAHEYGHAIQHQLGDRAGNVPPELQADCFAGAWVAAENPPDEAFASVLRSLVASAETANDRGTAAPGFDDHGTKLERAASFSKGFVHGVERCVGSGLDQWRIPIRRVVGAGAGFSSEDPRAAFEQLESDLVDFWTSTCDAANDVEAIAAACDAFADDAATDELARVTSLESFVASDSPNLSSASQNNMAAAYRLLSEYHERLTEDAGVSECATGVVLTHLASSKSTAADLRVQDLDAVVAQILTTPAPLDAATLAIPARIDALWSGIGGSLASCFSRP